MILSKLSITGESVKESNRIGNGGCSTNERTMASEVSVSHSRAVLFNKGSAKHVAGFHEF